MSRRKNFQTISDNYSMTHQDVVIYVVTASITVDLPIFDGVTVTDDDGVNLKFTRELFFFAREEFVLNIIDGASIFQINSGTSYTVPAGTGLSAYWYLGRWFLDFFDVASSGGGTVTNVATAGLISGGPITTTGTITTLMNTDRLVGRSTAGTGIMEEITVGSGLSLSGGALTASGGGPTFLDSVFRIQDNVDTTKQIAWEASGITTATTRTITMVDFSGTQVLSNGALTNTRVPYSGTAGLQDNANFVWDNTNTQLGLLASGTASLPTLGIGGTNIGIYEPTADTLGFTTAGVLRFNLNATSFRSNTTGGGIVRHAAGAAATPAFSFQGDTNTGIWNSAADTIAFSTSGSTRFSIDGTNFLGNANFSASIRAAAGAAATPTYSFVSDTDTGFWSNSANSFKWSVGGTQVGHVDNAGKMFVGGATAPTARLHIAAGTATASTAPLKFASGTLLTTPEDGAHEYLTNLLYFTPGTAVRNIILTAQQVFTSSAFVKTADTTFATITGLSVTATNTAQYVVEGYLFCSLDAVGGGKFQFNGTGTLSFNIQVEFVDNTGDVLTIADRLTALATPVNTIGPTQGCFKFHGHIRCTGTGSFTVEFAQQVASGASSVDGGSWLRLTQAS